MHYDNTTEIKGNLMTRVLNKILAASIIAVAVSSAAFAESQPSAKSTAMVSGINVIGVKADTGPNSGWTTILSNTIKTPNPADLFVDVSLECGLYTNTVVKSKGGNKDTSTATAGVKVQVLVDGEPIHPGEVTFCRRTQELTATFQGLLTDEDGNSCLITDAVTDANGTITGYTTTIDEECLRPEEVGLILSTMNANAFNFIVADVGTGVHTVEVQTMIDSSTAFQEGTAEAVATIGKGSVVVDEAKMIQDETIQ
jgi:hypothetical protein